MKITQVMLSSGYGGGERLFVDLCLSLADAGHQVQAICHPLFQGLPQLAHDNVLINNLTVRNDWSFLARYRLRKFLGSFNPDVIHTHFARGAAVAGSAGRSLGIPTLANMHNYVNLKYYRKIDHFLPGTYDQKEYLVAQGIKPGAISVIPHFSRLPVAINPQLEKTSADTIVSFGRFVHKKGFHVLLKSLQILHDRGLSIKLILGGDGPEKSNLEELTAKLGLRNSVFFSGWIDDVPKFLSQSPFFILPSLDEPFGIVILEAMAQGRIIISTKSQGPREILDESTAYLCEINDPKSLADSLTIAINEFKDAKEKAKNSLEKYKNTYSPEIVIPLFEENYSTAINTSGSQFINTNR